MSCAVISLSLYFPNKINDILLKFAISGIIYDVIVEPPSIGSTTDENGNSKPVRINHRKFLLYVLFSRSHYHVGKKVVKKNFCNIFHTLSCSNNL
jgi:hypothetical protein